LSAFQTTVARINWMLVCLVALLALLLFLGLIDYGYDDPYITYRYARNLQEGKGFVYNAGLRVQSTTTPLYTLLLAFLGRLWPDLPRLSNLISTLSLEIGALFLYLLARRLGQPVVGVGAALLYAISPLLVSTVGAETIFYTTLSLAAFYWYAEERLGLATVFAALAALTRTDGLLVAGALGAHHLITQREIPWRQVFLYGLIVAPWYLCAWAYFGSPFASTLFTKQQQAQMLISDSFWQGFVKLLNNYGQIPLYRLHAPLVVLGIGWVFRARAWHWLPLLLWTGLYFSAYVLLGVSRYFWYYGPLAPAAALLASLGWTTLLRWIAGRWRRARPLVPAAWVLGLLLLLAPQARSLSYRLQHSDPRQAIYRKTGQWLAENTPSGATVGMLEVGIIGYYARRPVVGFAGLIQPEVAAQMGAESTYLHTAEWAVQTYRPDYVVMPNGWLVELTRSEWFREQYGEIARLYATGYRANPVRIYAQGR
jgi:hypothetical protein